MAEGYCEPADVRMALQDTDLSGSTNSNIVTASIEGISDWLRRKSGHHWYDSGGAASDLVPTTPRTATTVTLDVPSSPHRQDRQLIRHETGVRYPTTHSGPFAKVRLPHAGVDSITALRVRDRGGGVTDWTTASDITQGRDGDWYIETPGDRYQPSYLYLRAASIGARVDYTNLLTLDYDYGHDAAAAGEDWDDVRRGVAQLAAADVIVDDDVLTAIPNDGQLIGVDTQAQQLLKKGRRAIDPYLEVPVA